jgi:O-antigen/teichoic acid export membrane protein
MVSCCASVGFVLLSHLFVSIVLGSRYAQTGWMLQLMGVRGALELYMSLAASMLFALGTSKYAAMGNGLKLVFMAIGLAVAFGKYGLHAPIANYALLVVGLQHEHKAVVRGEIPSFLVFAVVTGAAAFLFKFVSRLWGF